ncbi:Purine nucleoside phosphorylase-like protein [Dinothrombium tinctorium]|uniref:Purine nucleoside phosphorylase n=1 Tax=Dinothrombium tinctorium TaxID=1965070 RepID=A0A3S3P2U7_9ACAR|nr:Purine nucleoside phosphorylase-like protein [Dinothrombium tinctorium]
MQMDEDLEEIGCKYEQVAEISEFLLSRTKHRPHLGIICGSGLGGLADKLEEKDVFPYEIIPHFPVTTVIGHSGCLVFGTIKGVAAVCMKGRFHPYEGYPAWKCAMPVRVMKLMGVDTLIVTNAAGGINPQFKVGDIMIIRDHINFPGLGGSNPLIGRNDERWGRRFPPLNKAYDPNLIKLVERCASEINITSIMRQGVYVMVGGPSYETAAEIRALHILGADAVGMSTVNEVIFAHHCNIKVIGLSLITNKCVMNWDSNEEANHEEVISIAKKRANDLETLVLKIIENYTHFGSATNE